MLLSKSHVAIWTIVGCTGCLHDACAQGYPTKPIRIVSGSAGGGQDFATRMIAQGISAPLGQQVVVDNRSREDPGEVAAKGRPDGYTLLVAGSAHWLQPFMRERVPYDPVRDFAPITLAAKLPNVLVVHPSVPAASTRELIALAKAKPGVLNYASGSAGSSNHLATELFRSMAGISIVRVPYGGTGPGLNALLGGEVQMMFPNAVAAAPQVKAGKLRALGVTGAEQSALLPGLPTVAATLPGYESVATIAVFSLAHTPQPIVARLNQEMVRVLTRPDIKEKFANLGADVVASSPEQLAAAIQSEMTRLGKLIKDAGIKEE